MVAFLNVGREKSFLFTQKELCYIYGGLRIKSTAATLISSEKKYTYFAIFSGAICLLSLYVYLHRQGRTGRMDSLLTSLTGGAQSQFSYMGRGASRITEHYLFLANAKQQNEELQKRVDKLESDLTALKEVESENRRLAAALDFTKGINHKMLAARVVGHDVSSDFSGIRIDRGSQDGIVTGMGVISPSGVVGRVFRVTQNYSDVMTLVDPSSNIDAVIQRSRARGIVSGVSKTLNVRLKYLDKLEDVAVNDTVVSTDFGAIFPKGLLLGYVTQVTQGTNGILQSVLMKTAVDLYRLEEVLIVFAPIESGKTH